MILTDRATISDSSRRMTDEGVLVVDAALSRTGIQEYFGAELGIHPFEDLISVYRPPAEVFSDASLESLKYKPVTDNHPPEPITSKNHKKFAVGFTTDNITKKDHLVMSTLRITDSEAIKKIQSGKVELSVGYSSDIKMESGKTPDGLTFDAVQTNIVANHIAIVDNGRCGAACKISDNQPEGPKMGMITINDIDVEMPEQAIKAVQVLQKKLADAEMEVEIEKKSKAEKEKEEADDEEKMKKDHAAEIDALKAKLDDALSRIPTPEQLDALVQSRMSVIDTAKSIDPAIVTDSMDCEQIRKAVVSAKCKDVKIDEVSADYIKARFDALADSSPITDALVKNAQQSDLNNSPNSQDARAEFIKKTRDAWRSK